MSTPVGTLRRSKFPPWLKKRLGPGGETARVRELLKGLRLATVCQSARCPNLCECFAQGTATFMILGDVCTRDCRFCAVSHGAVAAPKPSEPQRVAAAAERLNLRHVVVTSVTRDDLPDGGAGEFRKTILALRERLECTIEVLTPDFKGNVAAIESVASARPDVYNHNVETVPRLYPIVRPAANYRRSLDLLHYVKRNYPEVRTKSGIMVGLGETREEALQAFKDLRGVGCDMLTVGQYLQPTPGHLPVRRYVTPEEFSDYERQAREMGFAGVACGPFVRSSYHAGDLMSVTAIRTVACSGTQPEALSTSLRSAQAPRRDRVVSPETVVWGHDPLCFANRSCPRNLRTV